MPSLSDDAIAIVKQVYEERKQAEEPCTRYDLAKVLDTYPNIIFNALNIPDFEMGATTARKILRAKIAYDQAKKRGEMLQIIDDIGKYKGGRKVSGRTKGRGTWGKEF